MEQVCSAHLEQEIKQHKSRLTVEIERSTRSHFCDVTKVGLLLWQHLITMCYTPSPCLRPLLKSVVQLVQVGRFRSFLHHLPESKINKNNSFM